MNDETEKAMLQSMATSLRSGLSFSFNPDDMADLLDRAAGRVSKDPEGHEDYHLTVARKER